MKELMTVYPEVNTGNILCFKPGIIIDGVTAKDASGLKKLTVKMIKDGILKHGYYLAVPGNGRNRVWKL